jgi:hypothetical protein
MRPAGYAQAGSAPRAPAPRRVFLQPVPRGARAPDDLTYERPAASSALTASGRAGAPRAIAVVVSAAAALAYALPARSHPEHSRARATCEAVTRSSGVYGVHLVRAAPAPLAVAGEHALRAQLSAILRPGDGSSRRWRRAVPARTAT